MTIESLSNRNVESGLHTIFVYINDITNGLFIILLLTSLWCIVAFGIYFNQKRLTGDGDFPVGMAVAGFVVFIAAILLRIVPGLISSITLGIVIMVAIFGVLWLFFSKK